MAIRFLLFILCLLILPTSPKAEHLVEVIGVSDGDSITVLQNYKQYRIRLYGIDSPEKGQAFGKKAKQFTSSLTHGKIVELIPYDVDKYKRIVAVVKVDGVNVNEEILRNGYAWRYTKYCKESFCSDWLNIEAQARSAGVGLWHDRAPLPPWEWRKSPQRTKVLVSNNKGRERQKRAYSESVNKGPLHGNRKSHVFHNKGCRWYNCKNCTVNFGSVMEARKAGYRPCGKCGG